MLLNLPGAHVCGALYRLSVHRQIRQAAREFFLQCWLSEAVSWSGSANNLMLYFILYFRFRLALALDLNTVLCLHFLFIENR